MGRAPCCENEQGLKKGAWTAEEDEKLVSFIRRNDGHGSWRTLPQLAGLQRCGKSCRLRWTNYLRPNIKRGNFTLQEEWTITQLHSLLGNKWSTIASRLPGRTDNEVKNHWNTHLKKQLFRLGIDPVTHQPSNFNNVNIKDSNMMKHSRQDSSSTFNGIKHKSHTKAWPRVSVLGQSYVSHMAQWELARLEAEGRQMGGKACATSSSALDCVTSSGGISQASSNCSRGEGKENEQLKVIFQELLEAPLDSPLPSLDTSNNSSSSGGSQFMNEADITSDLTSLIINSMGTSPSSTSSSPRLMISASPLPPCDAIYWVNMLSLVGPSSPL